MKILIETLVDAPIAEVWRAWTTPEDIVQWNAASDDWHTTEATVDLRVGGAFRSRMEARDGSVGFDFEGTFTRVVPLHSLEYSLGDSRVVSVEFLEGADGVTVRESFDTEDENSAELQRKGWQAILDNFARHVHTAKGREFVHSRRIDAPKDRVFAALADRDQVARWWGPDGFTNTFRHFDFRPGGRWSLVMHGPDGTDYPNEWVVREIDGQERVVLEHLSDDHHFVLTITFEADGGGTRVGWRQVFDSAAAKEQFAPIVIEANEQNLLRLASVVLGS